MFMKSQGRSLDGEGRRGGCAQGVLLVVLVLFVSLARLSVGATWWAEGGLAR